MSKRIVIIDCGAHKGEIFRWCVDENWNTKIDKVRGVPFFKISNVKGAIFHEFEPNIAMIEKLCSIKKEKKDVKIHIHNCLVATEDKVGSYYQVPGFSMMGTMCKDMKWVDPATEVKVHAIDLCEFVMDNCSSEDYVILKMDIEGGEYEVLEKFLYHSASLLIKELYVEWHEVKKNKVRLNKLLEHLKENKDSLFYSIWPH